MRAIKNYLKRVAIQSSWYNNTIFQDCAKFWNIKDYQIDVINLGSNSAKYGFDYSESDLIGHNWAMGPQSLMMDLNILQCYYSYLKPGATVLIPLCPFSCLVGYDYSYFSDKYYTILNHSQIPFFNIHKRILMNNMRNNPISYIPMTAFIHSFISSLGLKKRKIEEQCDYDKDAVRFINSWKQQFFLKNFEDEWSLLNQNSYCESKEILQKIVDFCKRYGFNPVIVMPPVSPALKNYFSDAVFNRCVTNYIKESVGDDVLFLNYFNDISFSDYSLYKNSYFLNTTGAKLFTKRVMSDLNRSL